MVGAGSAPGGLGQCCYFAGTGSKRGLCPQGICSSLPASCCSLQQGVREKPIPADKLGLGAGGEHAQELISSGQGLGGCCKPPVSSTCLQGTVSGLADILSAAQTWQGRASWKGQPQQPAGAGHGLCSAPRCLGKARGSSSLNLSHNPTAPSSADVRAPGIAPACRLLLSITVLTALTWAQKYQ